jgi:Flp pilus assembly protein CpaB
MKPVRRIWLVLSAVAAFALAGVVFTYATTSYDALVATTPVVAAARDIEPYAIVTADDLDVKHLPRAILSEDIYVSADDVTGRIATSRIPAGSLIYRPLAVRPADFRYVSDPGLEVVSLPVDPVRAVGGQIRIGQRVRVYRAALSSMPRDLPEQSPAAILSQQGAAVELLTAARVVDVRTARGGVCQVGQEAPALEIVTLAVPPDTAKDLVRLAVEQRGPYDLWLSLAPVGTLEIGSGQ